MRSTLRLGCGALLLACCGLTAWAGEEDEIVTGCHYSNAEWGQEMIDRCIKDNQKNRELVLAYPPQHKRIVNRCRQFNHYGWSYVKTCVDRDIEAEAALAQYPAEKDKEIAACKEQFAWRGPATVKACVDQVAPLSEPTLAPKEQ